MEDYVEQWDDYSIEFNKKLVFQCRGDLRQLDCDEQGIAALWRLFEDMGNGGVEMFFGSGEVCCGYALRGIERVGCNKAAELFRRAYNRLFARINSHQPLNDEDGELIMETDTTFWEGLDAELAEAAFDFYY